MSRRKKNFITINSDLQNKYLEQLEKQKKYFVERLSNITELNELDRFQQRGVKELENFKRIHKVICGTPNQRISQEFKQAVPDSKAFHTQIEQRRKEIKSKKDPVKLLERLSNANPFDIGEYNNFLTNPVVKNKIKFNPFFAARVDKFNTQVIKRYAHTIAALDQNLFLQITDSELFSPPWKPETCPAMTAYTDQNVNLTNHVSSLILNAASIEERTIIVDRWTWIAYYLHEELKDHSGCQAIVTGMTRTETSRLSKTFEGLPSETKQVFNNLSEIMLPLRPTALGPIFGEQQAVVPSMALIRRDLTFLHDGNPSVSNLKNIRDKQIEMSTRTGGGRKMMAVISKLQSERAKVRISDERDPQLNTLLLDMLNNGYDYDEDAAYDLSKQLEPANNDLEPAKPVKFGRVFKPSTNDSNQPTMRLKILEELIRDLKRFLIDDVLRFLKERKQSDSFEMDEKYGIDWEKEDAQLEMLDREIVAHIETIEALSKGEPKKSLAHQQSKNLINELKALDFKQIKMRNLESKLCVTVYKLKMEFDKLTRLNPDLANERIKEIEEEISKINKLVETCEFSPAFQTSLDAFNTQIEAFEKSISTTEVEDIEQAEKGAPLADWKTNHHTMQSLLRRHYGLFYLRASHDRNNEKEAEVSVVTATCS